MKQVGIIVKKHHQDALRVATDLVAWLQQNGRVPLLEDELAQALSVPDGLPPEEIPEKADLIVVLGGDGTLLGAARLAYTQNVPILGVNLGNLGFLTEITRDELFSVLESVFAGEFKVSERMMLDARILRQGDAVGEFTVLNDIVINKGALARIIDIDAYISEKYLCNFRADGLIVSTPTGSTGYNLAAGGPIITPGQNCLAISPICPFSLTHRPIVVSDRAEIRLRVQFQDEDVFLTADGQMGMPLHRGDEVVIGLSKWRTRLIASPDKDYFSILRTKLSWGTGSITKRQ